MILTGVFAGAAAGAVMLFLSHLAPRFSAENFVRDLDNPHFFGRYLSKREAHFLGILVHLLLSAWFGGLFTWLVSLGIFSDFGILSLLGWGVVLSVFTGGILLPLEGHGIFGVKEDRWFPVDLFITNIGWSILVWWILRMWLLVVPV